MKTQGESARTSTSFLVPPYSIEFRIEQTVRDWCDVHVFCRSGTHCYLHRSVRCHFDHYDELPILVLESMQRWLLWFVQSERWRRGERLGKLRQEAIPFPQWPSPDMTSHADSSVDA